MMKFLLLLILTQYAVKCDDTSNYYVIEVPEDERTTPAARAPRAPFRVYWNVPTMQCKSKKIPFKLDEYGIIQNRDDSFRGENIAILYDPGLFPALLKNESSGELKFRNGGVPQEGNMSLHLDAFKITLEQSIPDQDFSGVGIIDFESWRPVFRQNFGVLVPYKDVSNEIERKLHWWWTDEWIRTEAKQRFEAAARAFMQTTLSIAKQMRPRALWGYYGFPYCFNMGANNKVEQCSDGVRKENDGTYWLWSESTALYPSVYSSTDLSSAQLAALIRGRVKEANRVRRKFSPVLPYFWFRYRDGGFMREMDLSTALKTLYNSNATGLIIWGSSNDVNTVDKCKNLLNYVHSTLGPAVAKYTKTSLREDDELPPTTETLGLDTESNGTLNNTFLVTNVLSTAYKINASIENTTIVNTKFIPIDPKFPWKPPVNYSEEISHYVEEELIKKDGYNETKLDNEFTNLNKSLLMEIMINSILGTMLDSDENNVSENTTSSKIKGNKFQSKVNPGDYTTHNFANVGNILTSTSQYVFTEQTYINNMVTKNPLNNLNGNYKAESINDSNYLTKEIKETTKFTIDNRPATTESIIYTDTTTESYEPTSEYDKEIGSFDDDEILIDPHDIVIDTAEGTTEIFTLMPNATSFDSTKSLYDQMATTGNDESFSTSSDITHKDVNTITESTEFFTENVEEFITERSDLMKQFKKEDLGFREKFIEFSTDSPLSEISEPEQVVIYIS